MLVGGLGEARSLSTCPLERESTQALTLRPEPPLRGGRATRPIRAAEVVVGREAKWLWQLPILAPREW